VDGLSTKLTALLGVFDLVARIMRFSCPSFDGSEFEAIP